MNSGQQQVQFQTMPSSGKLIRTLGGIAMLSGVLVVLVYQLTLPAIEENKRQAIEKAIFIVLPGTVSFSESRLNGQTSPSGETAAIPGQVIYIGHDDNGEVTGIAAEAAAPGYQDIIRILYGYKPSCQCISGIKVLKMTETPGLGDKIDKDPQFLANFTALDVRHNTATGELFHPIKTVKHGKKTKPWQIDAISGATISSRAIGKMLNQSLQQLLPLLGKHRLENKSITAVEK